KFGTSAGRKAHDEGDGTRGIGLRMGARARGACRHQRQQRKSQQHLHAEFPRGGGFEVPTHCSTRTSNPKTTLEVTNLPVSAWTAKFAGECAARACELRNPETRMGGCASLHPDPAVRDLLLL